MSTLTDAALTAREATIHGLRHLADLLEGQPDLPAPYGGRQTGYLKGDDRIAHLFDLAEGLGLKVQRYEISGHYVYHALLSLDGGVVYELYARGEDVAAAPRDSTVVTREDVLGPSADALAAALLLETTGTGSDGQS